MTVNGEERLCGKCRRWKPETETCAVFGCKAKATDRAVGCSGHGFQECEVLSVPVKPDRAIKFMEAFHASIVRTDALKVLTDDQLADYLETETESEIVSMLSPAWDIAESIIARLRRAGGGPCELLDGEPVSADVAIRALRVARAVNEGEGKI